MYSTVLYTGKKISRTVHCTVQYIVRYSISTNVPDEINAGRLTTTVSNRIKIIPFYILQLSRIYPKLSFN